MSTLTIVPADDDARLRDWQRIHNEIIPTHPLSLDEVRDRAGRNRLTVAYLDSPAVGCMTVRPPDDETTAVTVIARILPAYRNRGHGTELCRHGLATAAEWNAEAIETVVLASNVEGLRFALARGFVEVERYLLPGDTIPYVTLRR